MARVVGASLLVDSNGNPVQLFTPSAVRSQVATAGAASTAATALPTGTGTLSTVVEIRATENCYINFGNGSVSASAASTSQLFPAGEKMQKVPATATHFAVIRQGSNDTTVQIELMV